MTGRTRSLLLALLVIPSVIALGCGGGQQAPAEQAKPAEPPKPAVDVAKHMHEHLARVTAMQEAVIRGDIEAAVEPAKWIADHQETAGLQAGTESFVADLKKQAAVVAEAKDLKNAATATAMTISYCGACHAAAKVTPAMPEIAKPAATGAAVRSHAGAPVGDGPDVPGPGDAVRGAVAEGPRRDAGLAARREGPSEGREADQGNRRAREERPRTGRQGEDRHGRRHEGRASTASTSAGAPVATSLHGKVWGPGLPKTQ